ncbi:SPOR domain-containing protein [Glaciimonas sp. GNP009]
MGLFSFFRKNKQQPSSEQSAYHSRAEDDTSAIRASRKRKISSNQSNDPADPVLPEKKRARRRLVGAVALVLAVVIVLPMVLDSEPKPLADDISIQIPSRDKPAAVVAADAPANRATTSSKSSASSDMTGTIGGLDKQEEIIDPASTPASAPISALSQPQVSDKGAITSVSPVMPSLPSADNADVAPVAPVTSEAKPEAKIVAKPKVETKPKVEAKDERKSRPEPKLDARAEDHPTINESQDDSARAAAILNGGNAAPSAEKKQGKFVIQVAALASQEKVDELQGKLTDAGIRSYTQKVKTSAGERIRIRVGPFSSKEEAEKARAKLVPLGLSGSLVPA